MDVKVVPIPKIASTRLNFTATKPQFKPPTRTSDVAIQSHAFIFLLAISIIIFVDLKILLIFFYVINKTTAPTPRPITNENALPPGIFLNIVKPNIKPTTNKVNKKITK